MEILTYPLGQMQANCYFVIEGQQCLVIDPGDSADFILEEVSRRNLQLVGLLATHGHFDHVLAVGEIQLSYPDLPLYISQKDESLLKRMGQTAKYFLGYEPQAIAVKKTANILSYDLKISNFKLKIIATPGHTPGSVCFYFSKDHLVFSGDTLFACGVGRYDFSYSDKSQLKKSLEKILKLPEVTTVYPGHGEATLIQTEITNQTIKLLAA